MSAIYQRARPVSWDELVGQEHVRGVLQATLAAGRLGHAYLFSGPRGVGKTTSARLIAMAANCESEGERPCGECAACREVQAGSHPDVLEIDAASNNSVDDVRELREKVGLSPMRGGRKVYILDEAHMMSKAAFNALLKTLEEPPEHVIFILATTEPEKILPTILSRCQHYRFRRLSPEEIAGKLGRLAAQEGVPADEDALLLLGRLADGAMRDGESLLERLLAGGERVTVGVVEAALGLPPAAEMDALAGALLAGDSAGLLERARALYAAGHAARGVVSGVLAALSRRLLSGDADRSLLRALAALDAQDARFARSGDLLSLELALVHGLLAATASGPADGGGGSAPARAGSAAPLSPDVERRLSALEAALARAGRGAAQDAAPRPAPAPRGAGAAATAAPITDAPVTDTAAAWAELMRRANMQLRAFLKPAQAEFAGGVLTVTYGEQHGFHAGQCAQHFGALTALVREVFGGAGLRLSGPGVERQAPGADTGTGAPASAVAPAPPETAVAANGAEPESAPAPQVPPPPAPPRPRGRDVDFFEGDAPRDSTPAPEPQPLSQEPDWDDIPFDALGESAPVPDRAPAPAQPQRAAPPAPTDSADPRAHPMFEQISRQLPGRAVGSGKRRSPRSDDGEREE